MTRRIIYIIAILWVCAFVWQTIAHSQSLRDSDATDCGYPCDDEPQSGFGKIPGYQGPFEDRPERLELPNLNSNDRFLKSVDDAFAGKGAVPHIEYFGWPHKK